MRVLKPAGVARAGSWDPPTSPAGLVSSEKAVV